MSISVLLRSCPLLSFPLHSHLSSPHLLTPLLFPGRLCSALTLSQYSFVLSSPFLSAHFSSLLSSPVDSSTLPWSALPALLYSISVPLCSCPLRSCLLFLPSRVIFNLLSPSYSPKLLHCTVQPWRDFNRSPTLIFLLKLKSLYYVGQTCLVVYDCYTRSALICILLDGRWPIPDYWILITDKITPNDWGRIMQRLITSF